MFCPKCGKQLADGEVCSCSVNEAPKQAAPGAAVAIKLKKFDLAFIISTAFAALTFIFTFFNWYSIGVNLFGMSSYQSYGPYEGDIGEISGLLGFVKALLIIAIIAFIAYIVAKVIDLGSIVPALASIDVEKYVGLAYYGLLAISFFFSLLAGLFNGELYGVEVDISLNFIWYLALIITAAAIVNFLRPQLLGNIIAGAVKKTNE